MESTSARRILTEKGSGGGRVGVRRNGRRPITTMDATTYSITGGADALYRKTETELHGRYGHRGLLHPGKRWGSGCTWVDYTRGRTPGLLVPTIWYLTSKRFRGGSTPNCDFKGCRKFGPRGLAPERPILYRNNGKTAPSRTSRTIRYRPSDTRFGLDAVAADLDSDAGKRFISRAIRLRAMFHNRGDGNF